MVYGKWSMEDNVRKALLWDYATLNRPNFGVDRTAGLAMMLGF